MKRYERNFQRWQLRKRTHHDVPICDTSCRCLALEGCPLAERTSQFQLAVVRYQQRHQTDQGSRQGRLIAIRKEEPPDGAESINEIPLKVTWDGRHGWCTTARRVRFRQKPGEVSLRPAFRHTAWISRSAIANRCLCAASLLRQPSAASEARLTPRHLPRRST